MRREWERESMGEDLFWAIRGGGAASFGVVLAWKLQLVDVPERVTAFYIHRTLEQNATNLVHRWQDISHQLDKDLMIYLMIRRVPSNDGINTTTVRVSFVSVFLGETEQLLPLMEESFPELGLLREDCTEMSWIESVVYVAGIGGYSTDSLEVLLNRTPPGQIYSQVKADFVQKPIPKHGLEGMWRLLYDVQVERADIFMVPYGGRMDEISESTIPFPNRAGNIYKMGTIVYWAEEEAQNSSKFISWIRRFYSYMTPYVSKFPRAAYINYRDLDIGVNNNEGETSFAQASIWGFRYFKNNFNRLVQVKSMADPKNFFRNEQSIPPIHS